MDKSKNDHTDKNVNQGLVDRLGRTMSHLIEVVNNLNERGISFHSLLHFFHLYGRFWTYLGLTPKWYLCISLC